MFREVIHERLADASSAILLINDKKLNLAVKRAAKEFDFHESLNATGQKAETGFGFAILAHDELPRYFVHLKTLSKTGKLLLS
jgi:hypothetical protein